MENIPENNYLCKFGPFTLDPTERSLFKDDVPIKLSALTFDLLVFLVLNAGHLESRETLIEKLWPNSIVVEHNLTARISALRHALGDEDRTPRYIQTVHGHGYRFISSVEHIEREVARTEQSLIAPLSENRTSDASQDPLSHKRPKRQSGIAVLGTVSLLLTIGGLIAWHMTVTSSNLPTTVASAMTVAPSTLDHSIAVLPFENLSTDQANAYFTQGVQEMILTKLADIGKLKVISRTSTERYKSHPIDLRKIANALSVATVLEGSVQKEGKKVLISVQLIDARSGDQLWAQAYTRTLNNVFGIESGVAEQVAAALKLRLLPAEVKRIRSIPTQNSLAYVLFLKAEYNRHLVSRTGSAAALARAITYYRQAIKQDARFALAYANLAIALVTSYHFGYDHESGQLSAGKLAADRALALAPDLAEAHTAKALWYDSNNNSAEALKEFERALALKPQDPMVHLYIGSIYRRHGQWDKALREMSAAAALDPQGIVVLRNLAITYAALRRYRDAINIEKRAVAVNPANAVDASGLSADYLELGDINHALTILDSVPESIKTNPYIVTARVQALILKHDFSGASKAISELHKGGQFKTWFVLGEKANVLWLNGRRRQARKDFENLAQILQTALKKNPRSYLLHGFLGMTYVRLGRKEKAIEEGQRAVALLPVHNDALDGPTPLEQLAEIYAQTDEPQKATKILARLLNMPAGVVVSQTLLKLDPVWNPIRKDPAFQALFKLQGNAPAGSTGHHPVTIQSGHDFKS